MIPISFISLIYYFSHIVTANKIFLPLINVFWSLFSILHILLQSKYGMAFIYYLSQNESFDSVENIIRVDGYEYRVIMGYTIYVYHKSIYSKRA